ncbi:MAG: sigma-70 family RNA polymerase sigma factor [Planctomycetota bacterium]|nr:MAG: sigma-70 family RNA polymerase sigma factor [Planctomycetota bacterium]
MAARAVRVVVGSKRGRYEGRTVGNTRRAVAGERRRERFERLVMPEAPLMYRVAARLAGRERADDVVQETVLRAWRYFDTFEQGRRIRPWLMTILRNVVYEAGRRASRRIAASSLDAVGADRVVGDAAPPRERLTDEEVLAALDALPEEFRSVVVLVLVEGFKYREAAEALGIPIGTVMSRLHRGRKLLRYHLGEYARREGLVAG